ncbi:AAA family ATPase [Acinetobacter baumannii]|uniref:AAA family ATPase n=3 Tax=Acinetobacter baumannii TaxID=470 RepID=UPI001CDB5605|nr:AAA family ATPase [Acinetobacter baumannii]EKU5222449.1 ATP-binding protein [Acinetobacter baumannii]EKU6960584.1 ATP-binding protein [Acinetobacter baumannii]EKV1067276.1 ATP-binding protein [Acinetobacter baumannii]EKV1109288.1 ATP-binding protein [Acinetobacter baumannii]EKV1143907.1 ATP-binding protein [Acinetobacter baumannii]
MNNKLYYWPENVDNYTSDNEENYNKILEIKRLNFFIGKNNAGKSRFLRNFFSSKTPSHRYQIKLFRQLLSVSQELQEKDEYKYLKERGSYSDFLSQLNSFQEALNYSVDSSAEHFKYCLDYLNSMGLLHKFGSSQHTSNLKNEFKEQYQDSVDLSLDSEKFYLPILRGMRPVTEIENKQPYIERAQKDYFRNIRNFNAKSIITGESLYHELKVHLLGEPEQRDLIKSYENKLSQYFFDNEPISLIPKYDQDVVNIKIGSDRQFPISELGDGLQQIIILTYEAFIKKQQTHSFFVEEPELHMHAGMVRQLMNFYLNETQHYYFFTTHSNHLLDMVDESDQVIIQKFVKQPKSEDPKEFEFKIYRCDRDRDLLASLGVKPSSVYLANCTIWVEGITDRLYITKYMEKYLSELKTENTELYKQYRRFMPNYHYTFVEYAGSNLTHWSFSDDYADHLEDKGLSAKAVASEMLLIADGDIQGKAERVSILKSELNKENYYILECKETENTLPKASIVRVAKVRFPRMKLETKKSYDISLIDGITDENYFDHANYGIGKLIDSKIKKLSSATKKTAFADGTGVGTIKYKLDFCREIIKDFDENPDWQLTPKAKVLCERIFRHIEKCNQ